MYHVARIKQWLGYLRKEYVEATDVFAEIRTLKTSKDIASSIQRL